MRVLSLVSSRPSSHSAQLSPSWCVWALMSAACPTAESLIEALPAGGHGYMPQQREGQMPTLRKGWDHPRARRPGPAIALQGLLLQTARLAWARRVCGHAARREASGSTR